MACIAKLKVMNSTIGLSPAIAAPMPSAGKAMLGDRRVDHPPARRTPAAVLGSPCRRPDIRRPPRPSRIRRGRGASPRPSRRAALRAPSWWPSRCRPARRAPPAPTVWARQAAAGSLPAPRRARGIPRPAAAVAGSICCFCASVACADFSAAASSPSARIMAIGVLTATSLVPSGTRILPSVPSSTASTSMVALSVSISAITSPDLTVSPSFFSHLARLPFSMVGESAGIRTSIGMKAFR